MQAKRFQIYLLTGLLAYAGAASAQTPVLQRIVDTGTIRIGMSGDQAPLNAKGRSGKLIGLEVELAELLGEAIGVEVELVTRPFPELLSAMKSGEVDVVMSGMAITLERSLDAVFVGPYMMSGKSILTDSPELASVIRAEEINRSDVKLAALRNSTSETFVEKRLPEAKLVTVETYEDAIQMIVDDEVDALVADMPACALAVLRYPDKHLATLSAPFTVEPVGIAVPASELPLQMLLASYLGAFEDSGILEMLRVEWLEKSHRIAELP